MISFPPEHMKYILLKCGPIPGNHLVCVMCDKRLRTAESLLEHFSLDHGITLWRVSEDIEEDTEEKLFLEKDEEEEDDNTRHSLLPLEFSMRLLQLKWMMNNHPRLAPSTQEAGASVSSKLSPKLSQLSQPPMEPSVRTKGCVVTGRNTCEYCGKIFVNLSNLTVHR